MSDKVFKLLGAHSTTERAKDDFYMSSGDIAHALWRCILFGMKNSSRTYEFVVDTLFVDSSVGTGVLLHDIEEQYADTIGYDIVDRGYPNTIVQDYLTVDKLPDNCMIVENTPFKLTLEFVKHSLSLLCRGGGVICTLQKIQFLEGQARKQFFEENPPEYVFVFSKRTNTYRNGDMEKYKSSAMCFCWFIFRKGYQGDTKVKWI